MRSNDTLWHRLILRITLAIGVFVAIPAIAAACSLISPPAVFTGLLGTSYDFGQPEPGMVVPRNFAIVDQPALPTLEDGTALEYEAADLPGLLRVQSPLEPGAMVSTISSAVFARVGDFVDTEPPGQATVEGGAFNARGDDGVACGTSSCGDTSQLVVDVAAPTDDNTPDSRLTYALYTGATAELVATTEVPDGFFIRDEGTVWRYGSAAEADNDIWVSVAAIDQAGNAGPRSEPVQVHAASGGCGLSRGVSGGTWFPLLLAGVWLRRRSRSCSHS